MDVTRLFELPSFQYQTYPQGEAIVDWTAEESDAISSQEFLRKIHFASAIFIQGGVLRGDRVVLLLERSKSDVLILEFGLMQIGVVIVPLPAGMHDDELATVLETIEPRLCLAQTAALKRRISALSELESLYTFDEILGRPLKAAMDLAMRDIEMRQAQITQHDTVLIIFTSGTTDQPKGAMLSHRNLLHNIEAVNPLVPLTAGGRALSFLPIGHIFERIAVYSYLYAGAQIHFVSSLHHAIFLMRAIRPEFFAAVPRILEEMFLKFKRAGEEHSFLYRQAFRWAIKTTRHQKRKQGRMGLQVARWIALNNFKRVFGNQLGGIFVGGSAMSPALASIYEAAGIVVREGYGMTETAGVISVNPFHAQQNRPGSVGHAIAEVEIRIANPPGLREGEILVRGPNIMQGYYRLPDATRAVIVRDDWLKTGDVGYLDDQNYLHITGRQKQIFKTSSGLYVYPGQLERKLTGHAMISQALVVGFHRPFISVLLVPEFTALQKWCEGRKIHWTSPQFMVHNTRVEHHYHQIIKDLNESLHRHERIREVILVEEAWTSENGLLTNTMKLKRHAILEKYAKALREIYQMI